MSTAHARSLHGDDQKLATVGLRWISWEQHGTAEREPDGRPITWPPPPEVLAFWETGWGGGEGADAYCTVVALVRAKSAEAATALLQAAWAPGIGEWRFNREYGKEHPRRSLPTAPLGDLVEALALEESGAVKDKAHILNRGLMWGQLLTGLQSAQSSLGAAARGGSLLNALDRAHLDTAIDLIIGIEQRAWAKQLDESKGSRPQPLRKKSRRKS